MERIGWCFAAYFDDGVRPNGRHMLKCNVTVYMCKLVLFKLWISLESHGDQMRPLGNLPGKPVCDSGFLWLKMSQSWRQMFAWAFRQGLYT